VKDWYKDFIGVYENAFSNDFCDYIIKQGEKNIKKAESRPKGRSFKYQDLSFDITPYINENKRKYFYEYFSKNIFSLYEQKYKVAMNNVLGPGMEIVDMKFQKTTLSEGFHIWHCEYGHLPNYLNRWGVYTVYLNDIEEGGETEFLYQSLRIKPTKGTVVIFPAYFTHMHRGNPPLSQTKYILTGWLCYPEKILNVNINE
jgi:hypothetical protein|tara:strand:+ start:745 stop:1344 length:600 start_codon:yes stop_codon:yes gene_type:complete